MMHFFLSGQSLQDDGMLWLPISVNCCQPLIIWPITATSLQIQPIIIIYCIRICKPCILHILTVQLACASYAPTLFTTHHVCIIFMGEVTLCNFINLLFSHCCNKWLSSVNHQYIFMLSHLIFSYLNDAVFGQNCKVVKNSHGLANSALQLPGGFDLFSRRSSLNTKSLKTATKQIQTKKGINEYIKKINKHKNQPTKQKKFFFCAWNIRHL